MLVSTSFFNFFILQKLVIANRQQNETEHHMLMAAQRENESLCRENKLGAKQLNELIEDQRKMEVKIIC